MAILLTRPSLLCIFVCFYYYQVHATLMDLVHKSVNETGGTLSSSVCTIFTILRLIYFAQIYRWPEHV